MYVDTELCFVNHRNSREVIQNEGNDNRLDLTKDVLMEIACLLTTADGRIIRGPEAIFDLSKDQLDNMNDWCIKHHGESGLTASCLKSDILPTKIEGDIIEWLKSNGIESGKAVLAGNSVHADKNFLNLEMPNLIKYLHYRIVDVSTLKTLRSTWYPEKPPCQKKYGHRAMDDILESLKELEMYQNEIRTGEWAKA